MTKIIREMSPADYDEAVTLWRKTEGIGLGDSDTKEAITSYLARNPALSFVARVDDELVGAVLCGHDGRRGYLHHLAVAAQYRGQGIGSALVNLCVSGLAELGIRKCNIFLFSNNNEGRSFWIHNDWLSRDDLDVMQKVIKKQSDD